MKTFLILFASITFCFAQETPKGRIIQYFDKQWKTTDSSAASFFRTVEEAGRKYIIRDYYISGAIEMEAECSAYTPELKREGNATWYYENGNIKTKSFYKDNMQEGSSRTFYKNGKAKGELTYQKDKARFNHVYSPDGRDYLVNGTGTFADTVSTNEHPTYLEIVDHEQVGSFYISNADTTYLMVEKASEYQGGYTKLSTDIGARLTYPKSARRTGEEGTVFILFVVRKDGSVKDAEVIKGFDGDCNAEALRVVKTLGPWVPAEHHNKKVNSKYVLPVRFKLKGK